MFPQSNGISRHEILFWAVLPAARAETRTVDLSDVATYKSLLASEVSKDFKCTWKHCTNISPTEPVQLHSATTNKFCVRPNDHLPWTSRRITHGPQSMKAAGFLSPVPRLWGHRVAALNRQQRGRLPWSQRRRQQAGVGRRRWEQVTVPRWRERASATPQQHFCASHIVEPRFGRKDENRRYGESRLRCRAGNHWCWQTGKCPVAANVSRIRTQIGRCCCRIARVGFLTVILFVVASPSALGWIALDWPSVQGDVAEKQKSSLSPARVLPIPSVAFPVTKRFFAANVGRYHSALLPAGSGRHSICPTEEVKWGEQLKTFICQIPFTRRESALRSSAFSLGRNGIRNDV